MKIETKLSLFDGSRCHEISNLDSFVFMDEMSEFVKDGKIAAVQKYRKISTIIHSIV